VASNQVTSAHAGLTEIAKLSEDDMLRNFDKTASLSRKKNPLHPATKFNAKFDLGGSTGFFKNNQDLTIHKNNWSQIAISPVIEDTLNDNGVFTNGILFSSAHRDASIFFQPTSWRASHAPR
jgi:hypothetical protein